MIIEQNEIIARRFQSIFMNLSYRILYNNKYQKCQN